MESIVKKEIAKGMGLTLIKTEKFKSNLISINIQRTLEKEEAAKNSLLPQVLLSGCEKYPSMRELSDKLDDLYGASIMGDTSKRGEKQIISFKVLNTNDKYIDEKIFVDIIELMNDIITKPLIIDNGFKKEYLDIEKENLKNKILSIINDKKSYAHKRCIEIMCEGEKYSIPSSGNIDEIEAVTTKSLYEHYKKIIRDSRIDIIVEGDFDCEEIEKTIKNYFSIERGEIQELVREDFSKKVENVKKVNESMDITQGKLVMGYRANIDYKDAKKYYALVTGCSVLGGGAHSKLFNNVREKESLCYYIFASVDKYKSIMLISSGIEIENREKTEKLIKENLKSVMSGDITEEELLNTKKSLINGFKSSCDGIGGMSEFVFSQELGNTDYKIEEIIEYVENVTVEDIVEAMKDIQEDTVYFLTNEK